MGLFDLNFQIDLGRWPFFKRKPRTALLVEDDASTSLLMARAAEREGLEVQVATTAEEARGILYRNGRDFTIAVVDVNLPQMNGWDLREELRDAWPNLRVVIVSEAAESFWDMPRGERISVFLKSADYSPLFRDL